MSAIQTLPFELGVSIPSVNTNYDSIVGRTYLSPESGQGLYRMVKWTAAALAAGALAGKALVGTGGTFAATALAGADAAAATLVGIVDPSMNGIVAQNDVLLVLVDGQGIALGDAAFGAGGNTAGAAVGTDANGDMDSGAGTVIATIVQDQTGVDTVRFTNAIRVELDARLFVPGV